MRVTTHPPLSLRILADGLGFPEGPVMEPGRDGPAADLVVDIDSGRLLRVAEGEVSTVAHLGGGPNGMALVDAGTALVANNGGFLWTEVDGVRIPIDHATHTNEPPDFTGGWIERVDLASGRVERVCHHVDEEPLRGPNDLVVDEVGGVWFTDHGKGRLHSVDRGALYYLAPGGELRRVAFPLLGPNGVGLSPDDRTVYVAETHTGRIWAWDLAEPGVVAPAAGSLAVRHGGRCLAATPFSLDSLAVEADGRLAVGAIGDGVIVVTPDGAEVDVHPIPGDVTTNLAFGGPDGRRTIITLSRSGRLAETRWPRPGLPLHPLDRPDRNRP